MWVRLLACNMQPSMLFWSRQLSIKVSHEIKFKQSNHVQRLILVRMDLFSVLRVNGFPLFMMSTKSSCHGHYNSILQPVAMAIHVFCPH